MAGFSSFSWNHDNTALNSQFSSGTQYSNIYSDLSFNKDIESIIRQVQELHDLEEKSWRRQVYRKDCRGSACIGSYNSDRNMMRIRNSVIAPLEKVLTYMMPPPYGVKEEYMGSNRIIERLGSGAVLAYAESHRKVYCCICSIAPRDLVCLGVIRRLSSNTVIAGMKTVEHSSYPSKEDVYRMNISLIGYYVTQEGDETHMEYYMSGIDLGGAIGRQGPRQMMDKTVEKFHRVAKSIPKKPDVPAPYKQFL